MTIDEKGLEPNAADSGLREDLHSFAALLGRFYRKRVNRRPVRKVVRETVTETVPVAVKKQVDAGPSWHSKVTFILGNLLAVILLIAELTDLALIVMVIVNLAGLILFHSKREFTERTVVENQQKSREVEREVETGEFMEREVPRDCRVIAMGRGSIPFHAVGFRGDAVLVSGPENLMKNRNLDYPMIPNHNALHELHDFMNAELSRAPFVLSGNKKEYPLGEDTSDTDEEKVALRGYEGELRNAFDSMKEGVERRANISLTVSSLESNAYINLMKPLAEADDKDCLDADAMLVRDTIQSEAGLPMEDMLQQWKNEWNRRQAVLHGVRYASVVNSITPVSLDLSTVVQYSAFNFYCPDCNLKDTEELLGRTYSILSDTENQPVKFSRNTRCTYDPDSGDWVCPLCGSFTKTPIPIHKTLDEVLLPAYDKLMEENKTERVKAHNDTRVREIDRTNQMEKEIESALYDQVTRVTQLGDEMERMKADISGENEAISAIQQVSESYRITQSEIVKSIQADCARVKAEVVAESGRVLAELDAYRDQQLAAYSSGMQELSRIKKLEDEKRDAIQRDILQASRENVQAIHNQTQVLGSTIMNQTQVLGDKMDQQTQTLGAKMDQQTGALGKVNATMSAGFKGMGINVRKRKGPFGVFGNIADGVTQFVGDVAGQTSQQTEADKFKRG